MGRTGRQPLDRPTRSRPRRAVERRPAPSSVRAVLQKVTATARRYGMFEPGERVVVAVSGGPDSMCLLHALWRLRGLLRLDLACFHFDHRLRADSAADGRYVQRQAGSLGIPFVLREARSRPARGASVEAWARTERYDALMAVLEELGGGVAAVGHTADDQAETVLLGLLRGGGLAAISGMSPLVRPIVRPLIDVERDETVAFCRALRLRPRRDPMNEDPAFMRVAVRNRVIPLLEQALGRTIKSTVVRTASLLREDAELLDELAGRASADVLREDGGAVLLAVEPLSALPRPLAGRVVREALLRASVVPELAQVEGILALTSGPPGKRLSLAGGLLAKREREYVRLSRPSPRRRT